MNPNILPHVVYVDPGQREWADSVLARIESSVGQLPEVKVLDDALPTVSMSEGKRAWILTEKKGHWIKKCPGTTNFVCCTYFILNLGEGCAFDCSYCYLQGYLNQPRIKLYGNISSCVQELDETFSNASDKLAYRVGTGEYMDSLALDPWLDQHRGLMSLFKQRPEHALEIKTKSHHVDHLLNLGPASNIIFSWSIAPPRQQQKYEKDTSTIEERLTAARRVLDHGFRVSFNLDPIIVDTEAELEGLRSFITELNRMFADVDQEIPFSMGTVRISQSLKDTMLDRWASEDIAYLFDEMMPQADGKMRYGFSRRAKLYATVLATVQKPFQPTLCMESKAMWEKVFGAHPKQLSAQNFFFSMKKTESSLSSK